MNCIAPKKPSGTTLPLRVRIFFIDIQSHYMLLQVRVGRNLVFPPNGTTGPEWTLKYTNTRTESNSNTSSTNTISTATTSTSTSTTSIETIFGGSVAASVIITLLIVAIPLIIIIVILRKRPKDKKGKYVNIE